MEQSTKTWLGTSLNDLYKGKGPWCYSISPVSVSKYHNILYTLPATLQSPPKPFDGPQDQETDWNDDYVKMPYSEKNLFPVVENGTDVVKSRWELIKQSLSRPINSSQELEDAIQKYNSPLPKFGALHYLFTEEFGEEESDIFFKQILPDIIKLALELPNILPKGIPLLKQNRNRSLSMSQLQVACILANGFLCTFPWSKSTAYGYPGVNFVRLFSAHMRPKRQQAVTEKLKCILNYFRRVVKNNPVGVITFERKFIPKNDFPRWDQSNNNLGNTKIHITSTGTIEDDGLGFLQVDFANKNVGGGVLAYGCVQEEIRFVICPELLATRLFVEQLSNSEAVIVTGVERYCNYSGYGDTFKWESSVEDTTPYDEYGRRRTSICIIDATHFNNTREQFRPSAMLRELNKAYAGFHTRSSSNLAPIATGNWGCGAFKGSKKLKSLLQLMACSITNRDMVYYSFGDTELVEEFYNMHLFLGNNKITIATLWDILTKFVRTNLKEDSLYAFIQQAYFDLKKQPTISKYFQKNGKNVKASSSNNGDKVDKKSPEKKNEASTSFNEDEDVIPSSQPEDDLYGDPLLKNWLKKAEKNVKKSKKSEESSSKFKKIEESKRIKKSEKPTPDADIAELIHIIDGSNTKVSTNREPLSMLEELDRISSVKRLNTETSRDDIDLKPEKITESEPKNSNIPKKSPKSDIAELIDIIDGNYNKIDSERENLSMLEELDRISCAKKIGSEKNESIDTEEKKIEEKMEVDESTIEVPQSSNRSPEKTSKRKISDYFLKCGK